MSVLETKTRVRSGAIDAVRVIGIVAIVAGHVWDNELVRRGIYSWHVPLFFFLTGYLWTARRSLRVELNKRARSLLVPYAAWLAAIGAVYLAWQFLSGEFSPAMLLNLAWGGDHLGRPFSAFWFVTALFIATIALRLMQSLPVWVPWLVAAAGLTVAYVNGPAVASLPLSAGVAVPALIFLLAGTVLRNARLHITRPLALGVSMLATGALLAAAGVGAPMDLKQSDFGTPGISVAMSILICAGILLIAEWAFTKAPAKAHELATTAAAGGFMVVLTHAAILWLLKADLAGEIVVFAVALVVPWALALLIQRTPMAPILLGSPTPVDAARRPEGRTASPTPR